MNSNLLRDNQKGENPIEQNVFVNASLTYGCIHKNVHIILLLHTGSLNNLVKNMQNVLYRYKQGEKKY